MTRNSLIAIGLTTLLVGAVAIAPVQTPTPSSPRAGSSKNVHQSAYAYVGTKKCRMCHSLQYRSLQKTAKGRSWQALHPGQGRAIKRRAGLDVNKDYTADGRCLKCHSVGFGEPGGYTRPHPGDTQSERLAAAREGVGCESCHGPGSGFVKIMQHIYRNERPYDPAELRAVGRSPVGQDVCAKCHNASAVCMVPVAGGVDGGGDDSWLRVSVSNREGYHVAVPFKYRMPGGAPKSEQTEP